MAVQQSTVLVPVTKAASKKPQRTIVMIGSTGNGKSTLGNFLLDNNPSFEKPRRWFEVATDSLPKTAKVSSEKENVQSCYGEFFEFGLSVIDTPGLNETAERDLEHMIGIIKELQSLKEKEITAIVLVVKFSSKIDAQYKATVQYYAQLLKALFQKNVIVVMTEYITDKRTETIRKRQNIDVEQMKSIATERITSCADIKYTPMLFTIDCVPSDDKETETNCRVREAILHYILKCKPLQIDALLIKKTPSLIILDNEDIHALYGEISGYNERLGQTNEKAKATLRKVQQLESETADCDRDIKEMEQKISDQESSELVEANSWSVNSEWKVLRRCTERFDLKSDWHIDNIEKLSNGNPEWVFTNKKDYAVKGTVEGHFMRGLYAKLTLNTKKKTKYEAEILANKKNKETNEKLKKKIQTEIDELQQNQAEHEKEVNLLLSYIKERRNAITMLSIENLTIEDASTRLDQLNTRKK